MTRHDVGSRRSILISLLATAFVLAPLGAGAQISLGPPGVSTQLNFGVHGARAFQGFSVPSSGSLKSGGGTNGVGLSVELKPPVFPLHVMASGDYYFMSCPSGSSCSYMDYGLDVHLAMPFPIIQPYALGGVMSRRVKLGSATASKSGLDVGVGVNFRFAVGFYAEWRYEAFAPKQSVIRLGIRL
jgi:hypothetical protein